MRKLIAISLGLTLMTGCTPELLKSILSGPSTGTTQPSGQQPGGTQPSGQPGTYPGGPLPSGQPGMYPPPHQKQFPQDCVDKFNSLDADHDKFVDTTEWANAGLAAADYTATDRNHDGLVDLTDFCDKPMDQPPPSGEPSSVPSGEPTAEPTASPEVEHCSSNFVPTDTNNDGKVDLTEWTQAGRTEANFEIADTNKDGSLDDAEFCAAP